MRRVLVSLTPTMLDTIYHALEIAEWDYDEHFDGTLSVETKRMRREIERVRGALSQTKCASARKRRLK